MSEEKVYTFNEYVLGYDSGGDNDRSCLTISKILNGNMYVMSTLYDGSAEVISTMLDSLQQKVEQLEKENKELNRMCELYGQSLYNADLTKAEKRVEQLENIRKEAIKYIHEHQLVFELSSKKQIQYWFDEFYRDLLNILNKGSEE